MNGGAKVHTASPTPYLKTNFIVNEVLSRVAHTIQSSNGCFTYLSTCGCPNPQCVLKKLDLPLNLASNVQVLCKQKTNEHSLFIRGSPIKPSFENENQAHRPPQVLANYIAISHVWGKTRPIKDPLIGQIQLNSDVKSDLINRTVNEIGLLTWMDVYAIDQNDDADKCAQVSVMKEIYENALFTLVVLGTADSDCIRQGIRKFQKQRSGKPVQHSGGSAIAILFQLDIDTPEYNSRAWTFQEKNSSRKLVYLLDDGSIFDFPGLTMEFNAALNHFETDPEYPKQMLLESKKKISRIILEFFPSEGRMYQKTGGNTLLCSAFTSAIKTRKASIPKDIIFAVYREIFTDLHIPYNLDEKDAVQVMARASALHGFMVPGTLFENSESDPFNYDHITSVNNLRDAINSQLSCFREQTLCSSTLNSMGKCARCVAVFDESQLPRLNPALCDKPALVMKVEATSTVYDFISGFHLYLLEIGKLPTGLINDDLIGYGFLFRAKDMGFLVNDNYDTYDGFRRQQKAEDNKVHGGLDLIRLTSVLALVQPILYNFPICDSNENARTKFVRVGPIMGTNEDLDNEFISHTETSVCGHANAIRSHIHGYPGPIILDSTKTVVIEQGAYLLDVINEKYRKNFEKVVSIRSNLFSSDWLGPTGNNTPHEYYTQEIGTAPRVLAMLTIIGFIVGAIIVGIIVVSVAIRLDSQM
ncbi:hypothetical protein HK096_001419, partial [Nowakowskiella sp. JEL0078]